jgi:hypothetical protein
MFALEHRADAGEEEPVIQMKLLLVLGRERVIALDNPDKLDVRVAGQLFEQAPHMVVNKPDDGNTVRRTSCTMSRRLAAGIRQSEKQDKEQSPNEGAGGMSWLTGSS